MRKRRQDSALVDGLGPVHGWLTWLVEGSPWKPLRGRRPEHVRKPTTSAPNSLVLAVLLLFHVQDDGWYGWVARGGLLVVPLGVLGDVRTRALHRTAVTLPPGAVDLLLVGVGDRPGRSRRALRRVFGLDWRQSVTLTRRVRGTEAPPVVLVKGAEAAAAERLAERLGSAGPVVVVAGSSPTSRQTSEDLL